MNRDVDGLRPPVGRERAAAVGMVLAAAVSVQIGAAFAVTLFDELGPAGAAFLRLAFAAIVLSPMTTWPVRGLTSTSARYCAGDVARERGERPTRSRGVECR